MEWVGRKTKISINDVHVKIAHVLANARRTSMNSLASCTVRVLKSVVPTFDCLDNAFRIPRDDCRRVVLAP